jgi:4-hydroxybenzoate polyprenyltransferase
VTRQKPQHALLLAIIGCLFLAGALVSALLHQPTVALVLAAVGIAILLYVLFRRFGRPGDFSRSGWSGM